MIIEAILISYLSEQLSVPVYAERPEKPGKSFVLVEKVGSQSRNRVETATVAIQSYAGTLLEAAELNRLVKDKMDLITARTDVSSARLNSDYNFTDTATKHYRYQAVYDVVYF